MRGGALAVSCEQSGGLFVFPSAIARQPSRRREMMEGHDWRELVIVTACEHAAVVVERGARELAGLGLDAGPFDGEAVRVEAEPREHRDVVGVAMVVVAGVARRFDEGRAGRMLEHPEVAVEVVALDLVRGGRGAPKEISGEGKVFVGHRGCTSGTNIFDATAKSRFRQPAYLNIAREM